MPTALSISSVHRLLLVRAGAEWPVWRRRAALLRYHRCSCCCGDDGRCCVAFSPLSAAGARLSLAATASPDGAGLSVAAVAAAGQPVQPLMVAGVAATTARLEMTMCTTEARTDQMNATQPPTMNKPLRWAA